MKHFRPISMISSEWTYMKFVSHGKNKQGKCTYLAQVSEKEKKYSFHSQNLRRSTKPFRMFLLALPEAYKREFVSSFRGNNKYFFPVSFEKVSIFFHCPISFSLYLGDVKRIAVQAFSWFSMVPMFFNIIFYNYYSKQNKI